MSVVLPICPWLQQPAQTVEAKEILKLEVVEHDK